MTFHVSPAIVSNVPVTANLPSQRTAHEINPSTNTVLLAALNHLERLVQNRLAGLTVVNDLDQAVGERKSTPGRVADHGNASPEGELDENASTERVRNVVVPE